MIKYLFLWIIASYKHLKLCKYYDFVVRSFVIFDPGVLTVIQTLLKGLYFIESIKNENFASWEFWTVRDETSAITTSLAFKALSTRLSPAQSQFGIRANKILKERKKWSHKKMDKMVRHFLDGYIDFFTLKTLNWFKGIDVINLIHMNVVVIFS